jgi:hypothetical protein
MAGSKSPQQQQQARLLESERDSKSWRVGLLFCDYWGQGNCKGREFYCQVRAPLEPAQDQHSAKWCSLFGLPDYEKLLKNSDVGWGITLQFRNAALCSAAPVKQFKLLSRILPWNALYFTPLSWYDFDGTMAKHKWLCNRLHANAMHIAYFCFAGVCK